MKLFKENFLNFNSQIQTYEKPLQNSSKLKSFKKLNIYLIVKLQKVKTKEMSLAEFTFRS